VTTVTPASDDFFRRYLPSHSIKMLKIRTLQHPHNVLPQWLFGVALHAHPNYHSGQVPNRRSRQKPTQMHSSQETKGGHTNTFVHHSRIVKPEDLLPTASLYLSVALFYQVNPGMGHGLCHSCCNVSVDIYRSIESHSL
jgi:hypothetical protein